MLFADECLTVNFSHPEHQRKRRDVTSDDERHTENRTSIEVEFQKIIADLEKRLVTSSENVDTYRISSWTFGLLFLLALGVIVILLWNWPTRS